MADAFIEMQNAPDAAELTREDWLGLLVDREATSRENKRLARRLREARLPLTPTVGREPVALAVGGSRLGRGSGRRHGHARIDLARAPRRRSR